MRTETVKSERRDAQPLPLLISHQKLARSLELPIYSTVVSLVLLSLSFMVALYSAILLSILSDSTGNSLDNAIDPSGRFPHSVLLSLRFKQGDSESSC